MIGIIKIFTIIIIHTLITDADAGCTYKYNTVTCRHDMFCEGALSGVLWEDFQHSPEIYYGHNVNNLDCEIENTVSIQGLAINTIDLVYKRSALSKYRILPHIDEINDRDAYILKTFHSIDLSNNAISFIPELELMENLEEANLSNNMFTVAKLSNGYELKSLIKIDMSHNNINQITVVDIESVYKSLKHLNLSYNYLVQIPEAVFDEINNLEVLDLSNNFIETLTPVTFEGVKKLTHLNLSHNRLPDIGSSLFRFTELHALDLSENKIKHLEGIEFEKLRSLNDLKLDHNLISIIDKRTFSKLFELKTLTINNNRLLSLDPDTFLYNIALQTIDLSNNKFSILPKNLFKTNLNLENFSIYGNCLEGALTRGTFEGLKNVKELDLRNQNITSIEDFAFLGLDKVTSILLNHNKIQLLSNKSFNNLKELNMLDLSNNAIRNIDFEKDDLIQLQSLLLKDNNITHIAHEQFSGLNRLQFLDISNNNILQLESNSFHSLENLVTFQISNNPLGEIILENTFEGLNTLPVLDISHTLISSIHNYTFKGMLGLKDLNISHSKLKELQFNCFVNIDSVERIDLSYNFLTSFNLNTTGLMNLDSILLNNNHIKRIDSNSFIGLLRVTRINLAYNDLELVDSESFKNQLDLRYLDLSYNNKFKFYSKLLGTTKQLQSLILSGVNGNVTFSNIGDMIISSVDLSDLKIDDISKLQLKELKHLNTVIMRQNSIAQLKIGDFANMTKMIDLDLSYNNISFIQPGTFKENIMLEHLNLSHNSLTNIAYGIFRGLNYLSVIDVSYNFINRIESERFYEVPSLNTLLVDHNLITDVNLDEMPGNSLTLSIGENPLPCDVLVKLNKQRSYLKITAIVLHDNTAENVLGISCNIKNNNGQYPTDKSNTNYDTSALNEIKAILLKISNREDLPQHVNYPTNTDGNLTTFVNNLEKSFNVTSISLASNMNLTTELLIKQINNYSLVQTINNEISRETNSILNKILNSLAVPSETKTTTALPLPVIKENTTFEQILPYLDRISLLEKTINQYKQFMATMVGNLTDLNAKITYLDSQLQSKAVTTDEPKHEQLMSSERSDTKSYFTEICVSMILVILVLYVLIQVYKSKVFIRKRWSVSTNQLPDAMDSSNL